MTAIDKLQAFQFRAEHYGIMDLIRTLELHEYSSDMESFKRYATNKQHTQLLVEDVYSGSGQTSSEWIDASEWNKQQCYDFLGY